MSTATVWDELKGSNLRSDRALLMGERVSAFVVDDATGDILETITFTPADPGQTGQFTWPRVFADRINAQSERIRAGEKSTDGSIVTLASQYRNGLWLKSGQGLHAFTTQPILDAWTDAGPVRAAADLAAGTIIRVEVRNRSHGNLYECLDYAVEPGRTSLYLWTWDVSRAINRTSLFLRAGEKDLATGTIVPLGSSYRNHLWYPVAADIAVSVTYLPASGNDADASAVYERAVIQAQGTLPAQETVDRWLRGFASGRFADIVYPPQQAGKNTAPLYEHLERTRAIAAFARSTAGSDGVRVRGAAVAALAFYTGSDFRTDNWWDRQIGLARPAVHALTLLADSADNAALASSVHYLSEAANTSMGQLGANQADMAYIQLLWSISGWRCSRDQSYLEHVHASSAVASNLCMPVARQGSELGNGISIDYSFSQHNPKDGACSQLYAGTYGGVLLSSIFTLHRLLSGSFSLSRDALQSLERFLLNGMGWFSYRGTYDFHVCGRAVSRGMEGSRNLGNWARQLLASQPEAPSALEELVRRAAGDESTNSFFCGNRAYWVNDYMAHLTSRFAFWLKTVSTRTVGTETGNGENLKGYYMGTGSCLFVRTGNEYRDIQPLWDWQRIPGTTVEQVPDFKFPLVEWGVGAWGSHDFSGAASDGTAGISSMILTRGNVRGARKTVFAQERGMTFVGSDIEGGSAVYPVCTSVEQCWFVGDALIRYETGETKPVALGDRVSSRQIVEICHAGFRYSFGGRPQAVTVEAMSRQGAWRDINSGKSPDVVRGNIFSIWIDHPAGQAGEYLYRVSAIEDPFVNLQVAAGSDAHLYVDPGRMYGAGAAFSAGTGRMELDDITVQPSTACAFIIKKLDNDSLRLSIADPTQKQLATTLNAAWGREPARDFRIPFPAGPDSGKTCTWLLTRQGKLESLPYVSSGASAVPRAG